jgi:histidine triad (HIT) family protein
MNKTIFQKIADREIPSDIVYEDDKCLAFRDVSPKAPTHVLVIPREPIPSLEHLSEKDEALLGHMWMVIPKVARELGVAEGGYRVVVNCGKDGGQSVDHLHFHILGGRQLDWPPG